MMSQASSKAPSLTERARPLARWVVRRAVPGAKAWISARPTVRAVNRWLNTPCLDPRYLGHPRWHLLSPRFHQWVLTNPWKQPNENVSEHWRRLPATHRNIQLLLKKYSDSIAMSPGYEQMARYMAEHSLFPVLDIGCGDGVFLRYLHEVVGVPLDALWGIELDPKRTVAARRQLYIGAVNRVVDKERRGNGGRVEFDDASALKGISQRILTHDVMGSAPWPTSILEGGIKAAIMMGVAPTLNNKQLPALAESIAALGPEFVLNHDLYVNIKENYGGRLGLEPFFDPFGYRQVDGEWVPEPFSGRYLPYFILQRPYWRSSYFSALRRAPATFPPPGGEPDGGIRSR
jgi:SAM-dependent methyltransferase